jgi:hypothetical protein
MTNYRLLVMPVERTGRIAVIGSVIVSPGTATGAAQNFAAASGR